MRATPIYALLLFIAIAVTGCAAVSGASGSPVAGTSKAPASAAATTSTATPSATAAAAPSPTAAASPAPSASPTAASPAPSASPTAAASSNPDVAAIKAVIQKADQEQQTAFTKNDPTVMKDTATSSYYNQLVQINSDMAKGGVSAINLVKLEWGQVKLTSPTTAQATTFETWHTAFSNGSSDQSRDQNVYTLVKQQGVWLIQTDNHPNSTPNVPGGSTASSSPGSSVPTAPSTPVPPAASAPASQTSVSRNWSGYAATSGTFTSVTGTWTVPQSQSAGNLASDATWVGIGGVNSKDLIQAGTQEMTGGSGGVQYEAWIETLPQASQPVPFAVSPGDSVTVSITNQGSNKWVIDFQNHTTGETFTTPVKYASSLSSAEWVEEAPSVGNRVVPIDNFGTVQFSGGTAVENGKTVTIAQSGAQPITMAGPGGTAVARPSVLTANGEGFSVSRSASTPSAGRFGRGSGF